MNRTVRYLEFSILLIDDPHLLDWYFACTHSLPFASSLAGILEVKDQKTP